MARTVLIDCVPANIAQYGRETAVVAVDVIRATTTAVTAVDLGRRCFPVATLDAAFRQARRLQHPLLAGELEGYMPRGFDLNNSPAAVANRLDIERPIILLSSSGTRLMRSAEGALAVFLACFRNASATRRCLVRGSFPRVALIGASSRGEFREEDQICCAWIAAGLMSSGYNLEDGRTEQVVRQWGKAPASACLVSKSVDFLRKTHQVRDLTFILDRIDDLHEAVALKYGEAEIVTQPAQATIRAARGMPGREGAL